MGASSTGTFVLNLFERYYDRVYWFARRSVDAPTAEDVAQEVFVRLLNMPGIEMREITVNYLLKVAENILRRRFQQNVRAGVIAEQRGERDAGDLDLELALDALMGSEEMLAKLNDGEREALRLIVCEGLSYEAAALALDTKVSTVNNWKFRGIQKLRETGAESPVAV